MIAKKRLAPRLLSGLAALLMVTTLVLGLPGKSAEADNLYHEDYATPANTWVQYRAYCVTNSDGSTEAIAYNKYRGVWRRKYIDGRTDLVVQDVFLNYYYYTDYITPNFTCQ